MKKISIGILSISIIIFLFSNNAYTSNCANLLKKIAEYKKVGNLRAAEKECKKIITALPNCAEAYFMLGRIYGAMQQYNNAIYNFEKTLELDPSNVESLTYLITIYTFQDKNNRKIIDLFDQLKSIDYAKWRELKTMVIYSRWKNIDEEKSGLSLTLPIQDILEKDSIAFFAFSQEIEMALSQGKINTTIKSIKRKLAEKEEPWLYIYLFQIYSQYNVTEDSVTNENEMINCLINALKLLEVNDASVSDFLRYSLCGIYLVKNDFKNIYTQLGKINNQTMRKKLYHCFKGIEEYNTGDIPGALKTWDKVKKEDYVFLRLIVGNIYAEALSKNTN